MDFVILNRQIAVTLSMPLAVLSIGIVIWSDYVGLGDSARAMTYTKPSEKPTILLWRVMLKGIDGRATSP